MIAPLDRESVAVVIGRSGGIGAALAAGLVEAGFARVVGLSRTHAASIAGVEDGRLDLDDEGSIAAAASGLGRALPVRLVVVATGRLSGEGTLPEKSLAALEPGALARAFQVNAIGPALCGKHFLPLLAREGRAVFACLSARVGSLADNRLGGWHGYRASKAALNMIVRNFAIETARRHPSQVCVCLHPGTVETGLSAPFRRGLADGQLASPSVAAANLIRVMDGVGPDRSGTCLAWDGTTVPF